ncbi:WD40 repeat-like protein [Biscogniauxia mediterranea]|nr:WD40 repeat-like protein [Biscogniauxia mediterranea]
MGPKNNTQNWLQRKRNNIRGFLKGMRKHEPSQGQSRAESLAPENDPISHPNTEIYPSTDHPNPPNEVVGYLKNEPTNPSCTSSDHVAQEQVAQCGPSHNTTNQTGNGNDVPSHTSHSDIPTHPDNKAAGKEATSRNEGANDSKELLCPNQLWVAAYKKLECDEPKVLEKYKQFLLQKDISDNIGSQPGDGNWQEQIQNLAQESLKANQREKLSFRVGKEEVVVRDALQKALSFIVSTKDLVAAAISSEPHAALAWAGVMFVFPLLNTMLQQDDGAIRGFEYILNLLVRCKLMEDDFLQPINKDSKPTNINQLLLSLRSKTIELYSNVYKYLIRVILHFDHSTFIKYLSDLIVSDDWNGMIQSLKDTEAAIDHDVQSLSCHITMNFDKKLEGFWSEATELCRRVTESIKDTQVISLLASLPVAHSAAFNSSDRERERRCTKGTRREILKHLQDWMESDEGKTILWLHGMAGTGKSTIAQTVANALSKATLFTDGTQLPDNIALGATFFFKQDDAERNHAGVLFTTLAHQLAHKSLGLKWKIADAIKRASPSIGRQGLKAQWDGLIFKPLQTLRKETHRPKRLIFIIDALDECRAKETTYLKTDAQHIIQSLQTLEGLSEVQVRVLVTSRHEDHIDEAFKSLRETSYIKRELPKVAVHDVQSEEKDDITIFLESELSKLKINTRGNSKRPSADDFRKLAEKAGGLFIYAATASKFLTSSPPDLIEDRLDKLLRLEGSTSNRSPESRLNQIYNTVLDFYTRDMDEDEKQGEHLLKKILRVIVVLFEPLPVCSLAIFTETQPMTPERVEECLEGIRSVVDVPKDPKLPVGLIHLSFYEFLLDEQRCKQTGFLVEPSTAHASLFDRCLDIMSDCLHMDICGLQKPGTFSVEVPSELIQQCIPPHLQYACRYWVDHLMQTGETQNCHDALAENGRVEIFLRKYILNWVEALSLIGEVGRAVSITGSLETLTNKRDSSGLSKLLHDATRFIRFNGYIIEKAPLQVYYSAILFSPITSIMRSLFWNPLAEWVINPPTVNDNWGAELVTLQGHTNSPTAIAISPDSKFIVSASKDDTVRLWEAATGIEIAKIPIQGSDVNSAAFSADGQTIAFGTDKSGIILYDIRAGEASHLPGFTSRVYSVNFSPRAGSKMLTWVGEPGNIVHLWDVSRKQQIRIREFKDISLKGIAFTPDDGLVVAGRRLLPGDSAKVHIWDFETGNLKAQFNAPGTFVRTALSPNGATMAILSDGGKAEIWNIKSGSRRTSSSSYVNPREIEFSSDGGVVMITCLNGTIDLWNLKSGDIIRKKVDIALFNSTPIAISADGKFIALPTSGYNIRLYDTTFGDEVHEVNMGRMDDISRKIETIRGGDFAIEELSSTTRVWDLNEMNLKLEIPSSYHMASSSDGKIVTLNREDKSIQIWDITTREQLAHFSGAHFFAFSPDGKFLVLQSKDAMQVLEVATWREQARFKIEGGNLVWCVTVQFSKDNKVLLWEASNSKKMSSSIHLGHLGTGVSSILSHGIKQRSMRTSVLSPDTTLVAFFAESGNWNLSPHLLWLEGSEIRRKLVLPEVDVGPEMLFSPDSARIAMYTCYTITLYDTATGNMIHTLQTDYIMFIHAIALDGKIAFWSETKKLCVWDPITDKVSDHLFGSDIYNPSFSDDCQYLDTTCGRLPLPWSTRTLDFLYIDEDWVYQGGERLLWLPEAYRVRPDCMLVRGGTIFINLGSDPAAFIKIDLTKTPLAKQQEASSQTEREGTKGKEAQ